jgi:hypothetical protein
VLLTVAPAVVLQRGEKKYELSKIVTKIYKQKIKIHNEMKLMKIMKIMKKIHENEN